MYIDIKFLQFISFRLENFKKKNDLLWNCRCPICGDGSRKKKARGYFFSGTGKNYLQYKCHNCGVSRRFDTFLKDFDPTQYGMPARYDESGNFIYPEGFDPDTQEWKPGFEAAREEWERQYAMAQERFLAHKKQKAEAKAAEEAAAVPAE